MELKRGVANATFFKENVYITFNVNKTLSVLHLFLVQQILSFVDKNKTLIFKMQFFFLLFKSL